MDVSVRLVVLLTLYLGIVNGYDYHEDANKRNEMAISRGYFINERRHRSVSTKGFQALKLLMKGAKQVPTKSPFYQKYIKKGTKEVAKEDFKAANPNRLTHRETKLGDQTMDGRVGGILIRLNLKDSTQHYKPTISVRNKYGQFNVKIVYEKSSSPSNN